MTAIRSGFASLLAASALLAAGSSPLPSDHPPVRVSPSDLSSPDGACDALLEALEVPPIPVPETFYAAAPRAGAPPPTRGPAPTPKPMPPETRLPTRAEVGLKLVVAADGGVEKNVEVVRSAHPLYDAAAVRAVRQWKYEPATRSGRSVPETLEVTVALQCDSIASRQAVWRGNELFRADRFSEAILEYQKAAKLAPGDKRFARYVGTGFMAKSITHPKDPAFARQAISSFETYLAAYPRDELIGDFLVSMYSSGPVEEGIRFFEERARQDPDDVKTMQRLSELSLKKGDFDRSLDWLDRRAQARPAEAAPYAAIGIRVWDISYRSLDLPPDQRARILRRGMDALDKALAIDPTSFDALTYQNLLYREMAKYEADPARRNELTAKADAARERALNLRHKS